MDGEFSDRVAPRDSSLEADAVLVTLGDVGAWPPASADLEPRLSGTGTITVPSEPE